MSHSRFTVTAGAIVTDNQNRVLLLKHRFRPGTGWGMPGGFLNDGEQPEAALRRELREEVSLEVQDVRLFATRTFKVPNQVEILFCCRPAGNTDALNFEIQKAGWFSVNELPAGLPSDQVELIRQALNDGAELRD
ncbi:MAG TPA: NUDIX hydrolase [Pyrinomonadaceae bacterium]|nr:NUDIX hydrolase [Pyrinomonadaceae bacterium]